MMQNHQNCGCCVVLTNNGLTSHTYRLPASYAPVVLTTSVARTLGSIHGTGEDYDYCSRQRDQRQSLRVSVSKQAKDNNIKGLRSLATISVSLVQSLVAIGWKNKFRKGTVGIFSTIFCVWCAFTYFSE